MGEDRIAVDFHGELTRAARVFPPRTDSCSNLAPLAIAAAIAILDRGWGKPGRS